MPSFRKQLGRSTTALRPAGTSGARRETVAEHLTASARNGSEASARTTFENTPRSSRRLAPLFAPGSEACTDGLHPGKTFAQAFRRRFGGVNFQTRIRDEARKRTQGTDESLADFLMNIRLIFKHLDPPYLMVQEIELVYNNLHPRYQANIWREKFDSFSN